jgi:signal transduction histidine kinase
MIEAQQANRAKSRFLATVSHELRTPLNAILGFAEVIRDGLIGPLPSRYREYGKYIHASGDLLQAQISQILDLSKIEQGELEVDRTTNDIKELLNASLRRFERRIAERSLRVEMNVQPHLRVCFDRGHLMQVVTNILDNAIKYNVDGGLVSIAAAAEHDDAEIVISDTGIGMSDGETARAHEPFVQFAATRDSLQGVGLGLSIVARLIEANGARMTIRSRKGEGTHVCIALQVAREERKRGIA